MEFRRLRYFSVLARRLHFARAAEELHLSQPALSQQIKVLERDLGVRLFHRDRRGVSLTPAGLALVEEAETLLGRYDAVRDRVREAAGDNGGVLRLAHTRSGVDTPVQDLVARFRALHPDTTLAVVSGWTEWNVRQVQAGAVDLAFVRLPVAEPGLVRMHLTDEELVAVLPAGHPLSRTRRLRPAHLRDEPVVFWPPTQGPGYHDAVLRRIWPDGRPKIVREDPDAEHVLAAVAAGTGLTILGRERAARLHPKGTTLRRFTHPRPTVGLWATWSRANRSPLLEAFVELCGSPAAQS